jgi:hypothetical protein
LNGTLLWSKTYAQPGDDYIDLVSQTADGGYMIAGDIDVYSNSTDTTSLFVAKTDAYGNMQWNKTYVMATYDFSTYDPDDENSTLDVTFYVPETVISTVDGGAAFVGINADIYVHNDTSSIAVQSVITKTDASGNIQWTKSYSDEDLLYITYTLIQTRDGGFALVGQTDTQQEDTTPALFLLKTAVNGEVGLAMTSSTPNTMTLYRGDSDPYWNYVRVRIWVTK